MQTVNRLHRLLAELIPGGDRATFMGSTALGVLVGAAKEAAARSGWLRLACAESTSIQRIMEVTQLDAAFGMYDSVDDAIKTQEPTGTPYEQEQPTANPSGLDDRPR